MGLKLETHPWRCAPSPKTKNRPQHGAMKPAMGGDIIGTATSGKITEAIATAGTENISKTIKGLTMSTMMTL